MCPVLTPSHLLAIHLQGIEIVRGNHDLASDVDSTYGNWELLGKRNSIHTLRVGIPQGGRPDPVRAGKSRLNLGPSATGADAVAVYCAAAIMTEREHGGATYTRYHRVLVALIADDREIHS